ncbi:CASP-like protein 4A2 isoform X1 [Asparagus officinalis]|uniref:CASP-like protein 4A2 isoform X1 n=1 Tax=Asparagus officinalis TaxID=4686 RepID=UPI00098E41C4|nr:CASP-like protein 4A2 isoform X1 [Asparagus officinalis]
MDSHHRPPPVTGSTVQSPPPSAGNGTPLVPRAASIPQAAAVAASPESSPSRSSKDSRATVPRSASIREEAVTGSPARVPRAAGIRDEAVTGSPVRVPRAAGIRGEAVTGSPVSSPSRSSSKDGWAVVPRAASLRDEALSGSPVSSPQRGAKEDKESRYEKTNSFSSVSSFRSSHRDAENPTASSPRYKDTVTGSPTIGPMTVASILRSPFSNVAADDPSLQKATSPMVPVVNHMVSRETTSDVGGRGGRGSMWVESGTSRQPTMRIAAIGLRILTLILSMISFSVMAADKTSGWDGDSFDRYREFRYCLSVNVLVFVYSLFQGYAQIHHKMMKKPIMSRPVSYFFNFFMDQILAYLLISASSSAASRNGDWVLDFGSDHFTKMIDASIAMSFLAFFALAFSSIISAYKFFSWTY